MTLTEDRREGRGADRGRRPAWGPERRLVVTAATAFAVVVAALWVSWPLGVALGLVLGVVATAAVGRAMHRAAQHEDVADALDLDGDRELRQEFDRLRERLGDDGTAFGRAALLVTRTQWASVAGLQRELAVSTARAQHLMLLLEREGFVGPAQGSRRRAVRVAPERVEELERYLGD